MWSFGCIIYELLQYIIHNEQNKTFIKNHFQMERFLFQGDSCFPLSPYKKEPCPNGKKMISQNDLMKVILRNIGPQSKEDLSYITNENVRVHINDLENSVFKN